MGARLLARAAATAVRAIMPATGSLTSGQTAGGKRKGVIWDLVKDVESVISKMSEKRWVCRFCEKPFQ